MALDREIKIPFEPSTIETIDAAILKHVKEMELFTDTNEGFKKVPVFWASPERSFQSKVGQEIRDKQGALIYPIISVERTGIVKDPNKRGTVWANIPPEDDLQGGSIPVARRINQYKTKNFANADAKLRRGQLNFPRPNNKVVYQTLSMPLPVYVEATYKITIRTEYQQQINDLVTPFITRPGGINYILLKHEHHRYEAFVQQDFAQKNNSTDYSDEERRYETEITIKVLGYLIGDGKNQEKPFYAVRENAVEVKIPRERIIFGDALEHDNGKLYGLSGVSPTQTDLEGLPFLGGIITGRGTTSPGGGSQGVASTGITELTLPESLDRVMAIREIPLNNVTGLPGPGSSAVKFTTSYNILENTETLFINGLLQTPNVHYRVNSSKEIELIGIFSAETGSPLKSPAESGIPNRDVLIISYIIN